MIRKIVWLAITVALLAGLAAIPAQAATEEEIQEAIDAGVAWLVEQQNPDGSWVDDEWVMPTGATGFAVVKLEDYAIEQEYDSPFDEDYPYHQNVIDGLNFIFQQASVSACDGIVFAAGWEEGYSTGIAMMAIAGSRDPDMVVSVGNPAVDGMTHLEVLQATVDHLVCAQNPDGGWRYYWLDDPSDNSVTGMVVLGLRYAEDFGCTIPASIKAGLDSWIDFIQDDVDGDFRDGGSWYTDDWPWVNVYRTGNLLFEMAFVGDTTADQRVQDAIDYIERAWNDPADEWGYAQWQGNYLAMYSLMKGFESLGIETIDVGGPLDWFDAFAEAIVSAQLPDGSWPWDWWGDPILTTEWALLVLEKVAPPPPVTDKIEVEKGYTYTNVCFEKDNDLDGQFNEDPVDLIDNDGDGMIDEDPVDCPSGTFLGNPLPNDGEGTFAVYAVVNSKTGKVSSYNPGQYYAVSTINVLADVDMLTIEEDFSDCIDTKISALNPAKGGGAVVVVKIEPGDDVAYQILDAKSPEVSIVDNVATVELGAQEAGTTILVYVKFAPGMKGQLASNIAEECVNTNSAWYVEDPVEGDIFSDSATLVVIH